MEDAAVLTLDDYLADPKLAAEFVGAALPSDGALLVLLYAVEEFDALATLPTASEQAEVCARTLLDNLRALRDSSDGSQQLPSASSMGNAGPRTLATLSQLALPTAEDVDTLVRTAQLAGGGLALAPAATALFRSVHSAVYTELDAAFTQQFTRSSEYARLMADRQRELQAARQLDSALLLVDALFEGEWASTVLWAFLFRVSRHARLILLMDVRYRLESMFTTYLNAPTGDGRQYRQLVTQFDAVASKFLLKTSPVPLPTASIDVARLKAAAVTHIARLTASSTASESEEASRARLASAMEGVRSLASSVRAEFAAAEKLAAFSASALFREFVTSPSAPRGDVVRLFRAARVPFHQAPKRKARPCDLLAEYAAKRQLRAVGGGGSTDYCDDSLIYRVFAFERRNVETESGRTMFVDLVKRCHRGELQREEVLNGGGDDSMLLRTIEGFLTPEVAPNVLVLDEHCAQRRLAFHFVAGAGDDALYGAAIRVPMRLPIGSGDGEGTTEVATQGVCVLSRAPLVDSLRRFVHTFWRRLDVIWAATDSLGPPSERVADVDADRVREARAAAQAAFDAFVDERHAVSASALADYEQEEECAPPTLDVQLRELFESLSVSNVVRVFGCLVSEKKLVLVSSSFSLLVAAGEALRALLFPLAWAHVFAPVLPLSLRAYLQCPSPFLFGLHASYLRDCELPSDVVVVDLDRDVVTCNEGAEDTDAALSGLRDTLLALCRLRVFTRDDIDYEGGGSGTERSFPEREVRLAFRRQLGSMLSTLEAAAFRFESFGDSEAATNVVVAVVDAPRDEKQGPERDDRPEARLLAALRQSQAFSAHVCRPHCPKV